MLIQSARTTSMLSKERVLGWLVRAAALMKENRDFLTELDAAIGDADHGINLDRGFKRVSSQLASFKDKDIGSILKSTGLSLVSSVGGASGPLYGTMFLRAGESASGKKALALGELAIALEEGLKGIMERGRAQPGDKTMIDALFPAITALKKAEEEGKTLAEALGKAVPAAEHGMEATIPMKAKKGRASYLGERSIGHQDPGATSSYLMLKALLDVITE